MYEDFEMNFRRLMEAKETDDDQIQISLRPKMFDDYVGQKAVCNKLHIAIGAAKRRGEALDHILLHGPPGLGKTTLAGIIASAMGVGFKATSGPVIEKPSDLAAILSGLNAHDVLFIDEIHRLSRIVEEILYPAMEDFSIDILVGQGPSSRSVKLELKPFTLIGATTRTGMLTAPLRDRFGIIERFDFYSPEELAQIVTRSAKILGIKTEPEGTMQIAKRSRGTPRIANRLLKRTRDYAEELADSVITGEVADKALTMLEIDERGFDKMDHLLLLTIMEKFGGGPVGLETLAAAINEDKDTVEDVYEPYLMQQGFIVRTPRGRETTGLAHRYFYK